MIWLQSNAPYLLDGHSLFSLDATSRSLLSAQSLSTRFLPVDQPRFCAPPFYAALLFSVILCGPVCCSDRMLLIGMLKKDPWHGFHTMCISSAFVLLLLQRMRSGLASSHGLKPQPSALPEMAFQLRLLHPLLCITSVNRQS